MTRRVSVVGLASCIFAVSAIPALARRLELSGTEQTLLRLAWHAAFYALGFAIIYPMFRAARSNDQDKWSRVVTTAACLLAVTLLVRLPYWFVSRIGDEASLIIIGQNFADGFLPYTGIWDIKPPGAYAAFGALVSMGRHLIPIRVAGALMVLVSALLIASSGRRPFSTAVFGPLLLIVFVSTLEEGQATISEHVVLVPLTLLLLIALKPAHDTRDSLAIGLLLGLSMLVRSNVTFIVPAAIVATVQRGRDHNGQLDRRNLLALMTGVAAPLLAVAGVYFALGYGDALFRGIITGPFATPYVSLMNIPWAVDELLEKVSVLASGNAVLLWSTAAFGAFVALRSRSPGERRDARLVLVFLAAVLLSILAMSASAYHYLILVVPFLALLGGRWLERLADQSMPTAAALVALGLALPLMGTPGQYAEIGDRIRRGDAVMADDGYEVAAYLQSHSARNEYVYTIGSGYIAPWLAGAHFAGRFAEPRQMSIPTVVQAFAGPDATVESELMAPFKRQPRFVILDAGEEHPEVVWQHLRAHYDDAVSLGAYQVYERR